ncbi:conserved hypothetical protein [Neospora caninum Liverpool]|uniref:Origin recognition complex subunit n=1 Tax=Neospora caninum (strain Liverpool) TaxID=572307 RepID=F0V9U8_NEOCL|nr:conserved hypothetical protein [Neospora caninum Liverpool]CBZ50710.1 conserved hypothetical protein [Neospora caninum Liverpool]|eukprot:XP_003880743.1 conserved hypothetical protein [Neospora caninum Liverpool]
MTSLSPRPQRRPSPPSSDSSASCSCSTPGCTGCMLCAPPPLSDVLNLRFSDGSFLLSHLHRLLRHRLHLASRGWLHNPLPLPLLLSTSSSSSSASSSSSVSASLSRLEASLEATASPLQRWKKQTAHASPRETAKETPRAPSESLSPHSVEAVAMELSRKLSCCLQLKEKTSVLLLGPPGAGKTTALEMALNAVQRIAREQREHQAYLHFKRENKTDTTQNTTGDPQNTPQSKTEVKGEAAASFASDFNSACVSSPLRPAPPSLSLSSLSASTLLPDLLVIRLSCPLYRDDASLLYAIVSQLARDLRCQKIPAPSASVEELSHTLRLILEDSCSVFGRAVVIVLDRFERCCLDAAGERRRQQLLYNLFDLQHGSDLQICTVCVSAVLDITQHMEKRIRSRFSLQTLYVAGPASFPRFSDFLRNNLLDVTGPLLLRSAAEAARTERFFLASLALDARDSLAEDAREEDTSGKSPKKRRAEAEEISLERPAGCAPVSARDVLHEMCWAPTETDRLCAQVFARAFCAAVDEEFAAQQFRASRREREKEEETLACEREGGETWEEANRKVLASTWRKETRVRRHGREEKEEGRRESWRDKAGNRREKAIAHRERERFFRNFALGRSARWFFSEIVDGLLSLSAPSQELCAFSARRSTSPLSAALSPCRESFSPLSARSLSPRRASPLAGDNSPLFSRAHPGGEDENKTPQKRNRHGDGDDGKEGGDFLRSFVSPLSACRLDDPSPGKKDDSPRLLRRDGEEEKTQFARLIGGLLRERKTFNIFPELSLSEHLVLGAMTRLHAHQRAPKTFHSVVEQVALLYADLDFKLQHPSAEGLRRAFLRLVDLGVLHLCSYSLQAVGFTGVASDPFGTYVPCKFPEHAAYKKALETLKVPGAMKEWVCAFEFRDL